MSDFKDNFLNQLAKDVDEGLSAPDKYLKSKYFYDTRGDLLFRRITHLPEYYLTGCETEILHNEGKEILRTFDPEKVLNIVELGSGDGTKTKLLLEVANDNSLKVVYHPVDISGDVLKLVKKNLNGLSPVIPIEGDYTEALRNKIFRDLPNKLILFLGSNIGNFTSHESSEFMAYLNKNLKRGEHVLIGFDLVKDPAIIMNAYNDSTGTTSDFNLNLLLVLNRELDADFNPDSFFHAPAYDKEKNAAMSYLVSGKKQKVFVKKINKSFFFEKGESIFTEISSKYTREGIAMMANTAGFEIISKHEDHRNYFLNALLRKI